MSKSTLFLPLESMYYDKSFKRPRTPVVGMQVGEFKSSLEAKLWLKLFLVFGQDRQRKLTTGNHQNGIATFKCDCPSNVCRFSVQIKKNAEKIWFVKTAILEHHNDCDSKLSKFDAQLQVYTNIHNFKNSIMSPTWLEKQSCKAVIIEAEGILSSSSNHVSSMVTTPDATLPMTVKFKDRTKEYKTSKRAYDILLSTDPRRICDDFSSCSNENAVEELDSGFETSSVAEILTSLKDCSIVTREASDICQKIEHCKPYNWSPIHTWIEQSINYSSSISHMKKGQPVVRLTRTTMQVLTVDNVSNQILWTEIMKNIFRWSYFDDDDESHTMLPPTGHYFTPGCKPTDIRLVSGIHKFKSVCGEVGLRTFVKAFGLSGQSLVRMHTEIHCQLYDDRLIYVVLYEYPLQWVSQNGIHAAMPESL
jgi:hypothetical protein